MVRLSAKENGAGGLAFQDSELTFMVSMIVSSISMMAIVLFACAKFSVKRKNKSNPYRDGGGGDKTSAKTVVIGESNKAQKTRATGEILVSAADIPATDDVCDNNYSNNGDNDNRCYGGDNGSKHNDVSSGDNHAIINSNHNNYVSRDNNNNMIAGHTHAGTEITSAGGGHHHDYTSTGNTGGGHSSTGWSGGGGWSNNHGGTSWGGGDHGGNDFSGGGDTGGFNGGGG